MRELTKYLPKKKKIFEWYANGLKDTKGLKLNYQAEWAKNVYWMICLEIDNYTQVKRDEFMKKLKEKGIDSRPYFYPISDMPMYKDNNLFTPITHKIYQKGLNLPSFFDITKGQVDYICQEVKILLENNF